MAKKRGKLRNAASRSFTLNGFCGVSVTGIVVADRLNKAIGKNTVKERAPIANSGGSVTIKRFPICLMIILKHKKCLVMMRGKGREGKQVCCNYYHYSGGTN